MLKGLSIQAVLQKSITRITLFKTYWGFEPDTIVSHEQFSLAMEICIHAFLYTILEVTA